MTNTTINYSKLDAKLGMQVARISSRPDFNSASFDIFIRTVTPIAPGEYLDRNNVPVPGISIRGTGPSTIQTGTATGAALALLSNDSNVKSLGGTWKIGPV